MFEATQRSTRMWGEGGTHLATKKDTTLWHWAYICDA